MWGVAGSLPAQPRPHQGRMLEGPRGTPGANQVQNRNGMKTRAFEPMPRPHRHVQASEGTRKSRRAPQQQAACNGSRLPSLQPGTAQL